MLHLIYLFYILSTTVARRCTMNDFIYEYTNCDEKGQRWRVAVPRDNERNCDGWSPFPTRAVNCSFSCDAGMYLDIESQQCHYCMAGSYSLGGGIRFDEFTSLPIGFVIENFDTESDPLVSGKYEPHNCSTESGWNIMNSKLLYIPSPCISKLTYSAELVRPGYVEYAYKLPKNSKGLIFKVVIKNKQCKSYADDMNQMKSEKEKIKPSVHNDEDNEWQQRRILLKSGSNVITWAVFNNRETISQADIITITRIDIVGLAFTQQCTLCPAGTYSGKGAKQCKSCPSNFFSTKGSNKCGKCAASQYSGPRAEFCINRPKCTINDYYSRLEPCNGGKTRSVFSKIQPSICRDDIDGAIKLPPSGDFQPCPSCNPGMSVDEKGRCAFCKAGHFSQGDVCRRCPPGTIPNYGLQYVNWNSLPPKLMTKCEYIREDSATSCNIGESWLPAGDSIHSSQTYERGVVLELHLSLSSGFSDPFLPAETKTSAQNPIAQVIFEFETTCADATCILYFIEDSKVQPSFRLIASFNGSHDRRFYHHPVTSMAPTKFVFAFMRSQASTQDDIITDKALIYSINVTNLGKQAGGASACLPCATTQGNCAACPPGNYYLEEEKTCRQCPDGMILNTSSGNIGSQSCVKCGPGLESIGGIRCSSSGVLNIINRQTNESNQFDFSTFLKRNFVTTGVKVFAREGTSYYHSFNISLFEEGNAKCEETYDISEFSRTRSLLAIVRESVEAFVCRSTALPMSTTVNTSQKLIYVSPLLLGDKLMAITTDTEYNGIKLRSQELDDDASGDGLKMPPLHFFYSSSSPANELCPSGFRSVITVKCDPSKADEPEIRLPRACPDGTCDGCLYHIIMLSLRACPLCTSNDYTIIKGECIDGKQTVHSIAARHCVLSGANNTERLEACSALSMPMQILFFTAASTALMLCLIVLYVCRRNKHLEYKYMKIVESKGLSTDTELPGAPSCGVIDEDEEEELNQDRVVFTKGKTRLIRDFKKNRRIFNSKASSDGMETPFVPLKETD